MATRERAEALGVAFKGKKRRQVKELFKQKCREELKRRRQQGLDRSRDLSQASVIQDVMQSQWASFGADAETQLEQIAEEDSELDQDSLIQLWESIAQELLFEESVQALEQDDMEAERAEVELKLEEEQLLQTVQSAEGVQVACPVCLRSLLKQTKCVIWCDCGLALNTQNDSMTLRDFGSMLNQTLEAHSSTGCHGQLMFSANQEMLGSSFSLLMCQCNVCDKYEVL
eukprot:m.22591 g.22591  ORF g.22591 m.22591 type:complete len:228 (+) comp9335_c0_seq1:206-889(+)